MDNKKMKALITNTQTHIHSTHINITLLDNIHTNVSNNNFQWIHHLNQRVQI